MSRGPTGDCHRCSDRCRRYSQLAEAERGPGVVRLHVLQGVPLVDAQLARGDAAAVVADPGQEGAAGVVVVAASYLARLVKRLEGRPDTPQVKGQRKSQASAKHQPAASNS